MTRATQSGADEPRSFRRLPREHRALDALDLYARVAETSSVPVGHEDRITRAMEEVRSGLIEVAARQSTLHGWRAQALFEAIVASLGRVQLLKLEDVGDVYFSGDDIRPPDFRVVGTTGEQVLVEVKNYFQQRPTDSFRLRRKDLAALLRYCALVQVPALKFAVYWVRWNLWTLTDHTAFVEAGPDHLELPMPGAMKANEMGTLGDRHPGTEWPIGLTLYNDPTTDRRIDPEGNATFNVARAVYSVAGREITDTQEQSLTFRLMLYGGWTEEHSADVRDGELILTSFMFAPEPSPPEDQEFALHSPLSSIYSAMFNAATLGDDGEITALRVDVDPSALGDLIPDDYEGETLRVWRFNLQAASDGDDSLSHDESP